MTLICCAGLQPSAVDTGDETARPVTDDSEPMDVESMLVDTYCTSQPVSVDDGLRSSVLGSVDVPCDVSLGSSLSRDDNIHIDVAALVRPALSDKTAAVGAADSHIVETACVAEAGPSDDDEVPVPSSSQYHVVSPRGTDSVHHDVVDTDDHTHDNDRYEVTTETDTLEARVTDEQRDDDDVILTTESVVITTADVLKEDVPRPSLSPIAEEHRDDSVSEARYCGMMLEDVAVESVDVCSSGLLLPTQRTSDVDVVVDVMERQREDVIGETTNISDNELNVTAATDAASQRDMDVAMETAVEREDDADERDDIESVTATSPTSVLLMITYFCGSWEPDLFRGQMA